MLIHFFERECDIWYPIGYNVGHISRCDHEIVRSELWCQAQTQYVYAWESADSPMRILDHTLVLSSFLCGVFSTPFIFHLSSSISLLRAIDRTQETNKQQTKREIFIVATTLFIL